MGRLLQRARDPRVLFPGLVVLAILLGVLFIQPGGPPTSTAEEPASDGVDLVTAAPGGVDDGSPPPAETPTEATSPGPTAARGELPPPATAASTMPGEATLAADPAGTPGSEVASARSTPAAVDPAEYTAPTHCGSLQEQAVDLAIEQSLANVAIRATHASVFPVDYFICIMQGTGGQEALALAEVIEEAATNGATHAVLIDLWIANRNRDFAQISLSTTLASTAGLTFAPVATLGGTEAVVASGTGRQITLVLAPTSALSPTPGPVTLTIDPPMVGGEATPGRYQLFLPTP